MAVLNLPTPTFDWLYWVDAGQIASAQLRWQAELERYLLQIKQLSPCRPSILLNHTEPTAFLAGFWAAVQTECPLILGNPHWVAAEWQQVWALCQPELVFGITPSGLPVPTVASSPNLPQGAILIPTGGSSGLVRFAMHRWQTLSASASAFQSFWGGNPVNSCCVLPLYHVSGLMQAVRALVSGGSLIVTPWEHVPKLDTQLSAQLNLKTRSFNLSLVPTQLQRFLQSGAAAQLQHWQAILLGGAPATPELLAQAQTHHLPIALTYGMTETAAGVTILSPSEFLAGARHCGQPLTHAEIGIVNELGQSLPCGEVGHITIRASSLAEGYWTAPEPLLQAWAGSSICSDDLGYLDPAGNLHIVGRSSEKIISGGENIYAPDVEAAILASGLVADVVVLGVPDPDWGERLVALYVPRYDPQHVPHIPGVSPTDLANPILAKQIQPYLSKFKQPKQWLAVSELPRTPLGKLNRTAAQRLWAERYTEHCTEFHAECPPTQPRLNLPPN